MIELTNENAFFLCIYILTVNFLLSILGIKLALVLKNNLYYIFSIPFYFQCIKILIVLLDV